VRRVAPPTVTISATSAHITSSQMATGRADRAVGAVVEFMALLYSSRHADARGRGSRAVEKGAPRVSPRVRKFIGLLILLPGLGAYLIGAMLLADRVPDFWLAKLAYFAIAGLAWALPVRGLMKWMNSGPERPSAGGNP